MNPEKTGLRVASIFFGLFAIAHVIRLIKQIPVQVERSPDPDGSKLGGAHHRSHHLHLAVATLVGKRQEREKVPSRSRANARLRPKVFGLNATKLE